MENRMPGASQLVASTRAAGLALKANDLTQLRTAAQSIARGSIGQPQNASATDRIAPTYVPNVRPNNNGNQGTNHRAIHQDRPLPGRGR